MKPNEIALRHLACELIRKIDSFQADDQWEILMGSLDLLDEDLAEEVFLEIRSLLGESTNYDKDSSLEEDQETGFERIANQTGFRRRYSNLKREVSRRSESASISILKNLISTVGNRKLKNKIYRNLEDKLNDVIKDQSDPVFEKLNKLGHFFSLKEKQIRFLNLVYHETVNQRTRIGRLMSNSSDLVEIYLECSEGEARAWCSRSMDNPLVKKGLMLFSHRNTTALTEMVLEYISDDAPLNLCDMFLQKDSLEETFLLDSFNQSESTKRTLLNILGSDTKSNILLLGLEGTGKTELARSLARELGQSCYFLRPFNKKGSDSLSERRAGLFAATAIIPSLGQSILVVDEADKILATSRSGDLFSLFKENVQDDDKAWMNQFLDQSPIKIIFIVNRNSIDRSTLRRFNLIVEFDALSSEQTAEMVNKVLEKNLLKDIPKERINEFIEENPGLNIGSYAKAAETAAALANGDSRSEVFFEVLNSHHGVLGKTGPKRSLSKNFDENLLNLSMPIEKILLIFERFLKGGYHTNQLPMMFYGPPGTGKTELAHQLAKKFGMTLDIYGASDLLDPFVGMTEKLIAKAFKKSSANPKSILFIDEADSLFKSRASAERSWMVSQTNELLRQMENYRGIFIAATNFNTLMDEAAMRRFHIKLEFKALTNEKLIELYKMKFNDLAGELDEKCTRDLARFTNITPGDVHAVWSRLAYQEDLTHPEIVNELKSELSFKQGLRKITL